MPARAIAIAFVVVAAAVFRADGPQPAALEDLLASAAALVEALDYEAAVPELDRVVAGYRDRLAGDAAARSPLIRALELRSRARFGLGRRSESLDDLVALLRLSPGHSLGVAARGGLPELFEEARRTTIGHLLVRVTPETAELQVDGIAVSSESGAMPVVAGEHTVSASRVGYRPRTQTVTVAPGTSLDVDLTLERTSAIVAVTTKPPGVEVLVDGASRGMTQPKTGDSAAAGGDTSAPLLLMDLPLGGHRLEFRRPCYTMSTSAIMVDKLADFTLAPVELAAAVGSIAVEAPGLDQAALVFLDGEPQGNAPMRLEKVCEGPHVVEVRAAFGRYYRRLQLKPGDQTKLEATLRPAFALLAALSDVNESLVGRLERLLSGAEGVTFFVPPAATVARALTDAGATPGWLAPPGTTGPGETAPLAPSARLALGQQVSRALEVQGVAGVMPAGEGQGARLTLLALGAGEPDVVLFDFENDGAVAAELAEIDRAPDLFRRSIGVTAVDVLGRRGPIVSGLEDPPPQGENVPAVGEMITALGGEPTPDTARLRELVASAALDAPAVVEVSNRDGVARRAALAVRRTPRLVSLVDERLRFNTLLAGFRWRLARTQDPLEQSVLRLNIAVCLMRGANWAEALAELERVTLERGPGVSHGTVLYLRGLCYRELGQIAEMGRAWREAADEPASLLTEDGPPIRDLLPARANPSPPPDARR